MENIYDDNNDNHDDGNNVEYVHEGSPNPESALYRYRGTSFI